MGVRCSHYMTLMWIVGDSHWGLRERKKKLGPYYKCMLLTRILCNALGKGKCLAWIASPTHLAFNPVARAVSECTMQALNNGPGKLVSDNGEVRQSWETFPLVSRIMLTGRAHEWFRCLMALEWWKMIKGMISALSVLRCVHSKCISAHARISWSKWIWYNNLQIA